ncbi:hypothetical protein JCM8115_002657 [Rhodotorula mucilaginosa]|uniref:Uncharacterized protein n=1 Tax=Rhodotorula mucilaginosa TaxID=5537 RepID=A0A9P6VY04_RHOMI|nr:hypothetical protein C6P46_006677 [Rhodotorula mucilaginosa]
MQLPGQPPRKPIVPPPIPPSKLPQHVAPSKLSRATQIFAFSLATGMTFYAVLLYDFGPREHVFMPLRRWVDDHTASLFTLSDQDRQALSPQRERAAPAAVKPDTRTPIEYFKENPWKKGSEAEAEAAKKV